MPHSIRTADTSALSHETAIVISGTLRRQSPAKGVAGDATLPQLIN